MAVEAARGTSGGRGRRRRLSCGRGSTTGRTGSSASLALVIVVVYVDAREACIAGSAPYHMKLVSR